MRGIKAICLLGLLALAASTGLQAQQGDATSEKAVAALENQWLESQKTNNPELVAPLLADKFVSTSAEGRLQSKEEMLAATRKRKYSSVEYTDVHVTVFGNTAIATGIYKGTGTEAGKPFDETERWTDTWVKMPGGKWLCVADHNSPLSK